MTATAEASTKADPISVTCDTKKGEIYGTAEINAKPDRIFRALTTNEMADWWGQGPYKTLDYKIDLRPGGKWSCKAVGAKGDESTLSGEYITVDPPKVLEYTWIPSWDNYNESHVRFEITPTATGSRVKLTHTGFAGREEMCNNHTTGWKQVLGWLSGYVSK